MSVRNFPCENCCFLSILEKIPDGFILVDKNGNILMMNPAARRLLGIGQEAINGQPLERYLVDLRLKRFGRETAIAIYVVDLAIHDERFKSHNEQFESREQPKAARSGLANPEQIYAFTETTFVHRQQE